MTTDSRGMCDMMSDMDTSILEVKHDDSSSSDSTRKETIMRLNAENNRAIMGLKL